mgnify:CR=1 FL=1
MTETRIAKVLKSIVCICLARKQKGKPFCRKCFTKLPDDLRWNLAGTLSAKPADEDERLYDAATRTAIAADDARWHKFTYALFGMLDMADDDYDYVKAALTAPLPTIAAAAVQALEEKE